MKNLTARLAILSFLSSIALYSNAYDIKTIYNIDNVSNKQLMLDCGYAPGISTVYGGGQNYRKYYPTLGRFSSEIDSIRLMSGEMQSFSNGVFMDAKVKRDRVINGSLKTNRTMRRNQGKITYTNEIHESTMGYYNEHQNQLNQISIDITTESIKSINNKMSELEIFDNDHIGTMNDVYLTCKSHWNIMSQRGYKQEETSNGDYITGPEKLPSDIRKIKLNSLGGVVQSFNQQHDTPGSSRRTIDDYRSRKESIQQNDGIYKTRYGNNQYNEVNTEKHYRSTIDIYKNTSVENNDNSKTFNSNIPIYKPKNQVKNKWWGKQTPPVIKKPIANKQVVSDNKKWWEKN
jgi:hypothetical protein